MSEHQEKEDVPSSDSDPPPGRWRVLKFGGSSLASAERWQRIERIVRAEVEEGTRVALVCSAVSGVTNLLEELIAAIDAGRDTDALVEAIQTRHRDLGRDLGVDADSILQDELASLRDHTQAPGPVTPVRHAAISSLGEMMSTRMGRAWLEQRGLSIAWVDARDLLTAAEDLADRAERYLSARCDYDPDPQVRARLDDNRTDVVITQGFIARGREGETVLLGRGGSDTSAAYLAALIQAEGLEIWTDVPGMFTAHPQQVPEARLITRLSYGEAETLGALGAKVLHPRSIEPVRAHGIPVRIGWTARPEVEGTKINVARSRRGVKAIAARKDMALVSMRRPASWQPIGFMSDIAGCFTKRGLSMDLVSSSCSEIRVTIDLSAFPTAEEELDDLMKDLSDYCEPRVFTHVACVSIVGAGVGVEVLSEAHVLELFADEAVLMTVHAANEHHVSFVVDEHSAKKLVQAAHSVVFEESDDLELGFGPTWSELMAGGEKETS